MQHRSSGTNHSDGRWGLSRRRFLQGAAGTAALVGGGGLLAACGGDDDDAGDDTGGDTSAAPTNPPAASAPGTAAAGTAGAVSDVAIKIGWVTPVTGALAAFGEADSYVIESLRAMLPNVEIVQKDAESDPGKAGEVTQELINEGCHLILAGDTPDITVPVANQCALGEVPCITSLAPWQPHYLGTGGSLGPDGPSGAASPYNFHFFWGLEDVIENFIALWEQSGADKVVGGMWPNDPDGNAWGDAAVGFPPALEAAGFTVVDAGRFELDTQDFSAIIGQFKEAGVQIVSGVVPPPVFANFQAAALQQDFQPAVITMAKALLFPSAVATYPKGEGLSSEIWWSAKHPFASSLTGQSAGELAAAYEEATGTQWTQPLGFAHALVEVAVDVATRAGGTDSAALLEAIAATKLDTVVGTVDFSAGPVANITKTPLCAGQWVAGEEYPLELAITVNDHIDGLETDGTIQPISY
jgi:branched-chain amino acid transport system substrate-binding protein